MENGGHTHPKDQIGRPFDAELERPRVDLRGKSVAEIVSILTSPPIICEDGMDDPSAHVAAVTPSLASELSTDAPRITNAPPMAPGIGGPNLDLPPLEPRPLEGGVAVQPFESNATDAQDRGPLIQAGQTTPAARFSHLSSVLILIAIVAGITLMMFPNEVWKRSADISGVVLSLFEDSSRPRTRAKSPLLSINVQKGFVNEPLPLGVTLRDASGDEKVILAGLATGTSLSAGTPLGETAWEMLAEDVGKVFVYAPKDFVGIMIAVIDLRSPGGWLMDNQIVQLEWTQRTDERSAPQQDRSKQTPTTDVLDPQELAILFKHFLDAGDIVSARLLLKQAANSGSAQAALDLGMTFDPAFLAKWGAVGFTADVAQAREWYKRASNLGSTEAARRLEQLTVRK
jgi:hypothetical protein